MCYIVDNGDKLKELENEVTILKKIFLLAKMVCFSLEVWKRSCSEVNLDYYAIFYIFRLPNLKVNWPMLAN